MAKEQKLSCLYTEHTENKLHVKNIQESITDFEERIRNLEAFKNNQQGFLTANKHWITIGIVTLINVVMNCFSRKQ